MSENLKKYGPVVVQYHQRLLGWTLVDRPTQLICISDIYMSTYKYKRHSRAICKVDIRHFQGFNTQGPGEHACFYLGSIRRQGMIISFSL